MEEETSAQSETPPGEEGEDNTGRTHNVRPFVCKETGEPFKAFCFGHRTMICLVCTQQKHKDCTTVLLRDFCAAERARLTAKKGQACELIQNLTDLEEDIPVKAARLHHLIDGVITQIILALNKRRKILHEDIKRRSGTLITALEHELTTRKQELQRLESAKLILTLLSNGRGVAPEGPIGDLLRGKATYDEFLAIGDPEMPPAPTIKQLLNLNLPLKMREEILGFDWTAETRDVTPLVYPPKGY
eukprot:TRINITY_DN37243_c0_g1_i1.p1 TRINITY_DN37243_c0_g1~~TRINITY_DN37243_c0_g1_i1.p1  ORF type:complete len:252 (+),score=55.69 TRINITY_DN37243_c0_g1_i1:24-758(+)